MNNKVRNILIIIACVLLLFTFVACDFSDDKLGDGTGDNNSSTENDNPSDNNPPTGSDQPAPGKEKIKLSDSIFTNYIVNLSELKA